MSYRITSFPMNIAELAASSLVTGAFPDCASASRGWDEAVSRGYGVADLSLIVSEELRRNAFRVAGEPPRLETSDDAGVGRGRAAASAALVGRLAVGKPVWLPDFRIIVAGPIADALAGVESAVDGIYGMGFPENHAARIENHLRQGRVIVVLQARSRLDAETVEAGWNACAFEVLV